jgi:hypothetical protein
MAVGRSDLSWMLRQVPVEIARAASAQMIGGLAAVAGYRKPHPNE